MKIPGCVNKQMFFIKDKDTITNDTSGTRTPFDMREYKDFQRNKFIPKSLHIPWKNTMASTSLNAARPAPILLRNEQEFLTHGWSQALSTLIREAQICF